MREKKGLTQDDMKPLLGIGNTTCSNYENAVTQPDLDLIIDISKFFGVTLDELLTVDISVRDGDSGVKRRKHKPYVVIESNAQLQEQPSDLTYIVKELKQLRKDVAAIQRKV